MASKKGIPKYYRLTETTVEKMKKLQEFFKDAEDRQSVSETEVLTKCVTFYFDRYIEDRETEKP